MTGFWYRSIIQVGLWVFNAGLPQLEGPMHCYQIALRMNLELPPS